MREKFNELRLDAGIARIENQQWLCVLDKETGMMIDPMIGLEKFAELIVRECVGILETEIELVNGYKSTAYNDFDIRWHNGKIEHLTRLVQKSKKHFGVEE